jgi:hypothetical protein
MELINRLELTYIVGDLTPGQWRQRGSHETCTILGAASEHRRGAVVAPTGWVGRPGS